MAPAGCGFLRSGRCAPRRRARTYSAATMDAYLMRNSSLWRSLVRNSRESRPFALAFGIGAAVVAPYMVYQGFNALTERSQAGAERTATETVARDANVRVIASANKARLAAMLEEFDPEKRSGGEQAHKDRWAQAMQGKVAAKGERAGMQLGETEPRLQYGKKGAAAQAAQAVGEGAGEAKKRRGWLGFGRGKRADAPVESA